MLDGDDFLSLYSEWVIGNREDLAKDIIAEIQPENGEVMYIVASLRVYLHN